MESSRTYSHSEPLARAIELLLIKLPDAKTPARTPRKPLPQRVRKLLASEITQIVDAYQSGATVGQLAVRFGINRNTVTKILKVAGVPLRSPGLSDEQIEEAQTLYRDGMSLARIGERFGVVAHTVRHRLIERGIAMRDTHGRVQ